MQRLAQLLIQDKILDRRKCEEILESQAVYGGSFDTNLLELGLLDERTLQTYLERVMGTPNRVDAFKEADPKAIALLKRAQAQKYKIVPFRLNLRQLDILINDPTDVRAIDEVSFITGCRVQVNVTTEIRIAYHLFGNYQIGLPHRLQQILMNRVTARPRGAFDPDARQKANVAPSGSALDEMPSISIPMGDPASPSRSSGPMASISASEAIAQHRQAQPAPPPPRGPLPPTPSTTGGPYEPPSAGRSGSTIGAPGDVGTDVPLPPPQLPPTARAPTKAPPAAAPPSDPKATFYGPPPFEQYPEFEETPPARRPPTAPDLAAAAPTSPTPVKRNYDLLAAQLGQVADRDEIPAIVLGYLTVPLVRVYLFTVRAERLVGWDARGKKVRREAIGGLSFPLDRASVFQAVVAAGRPFEGKLPQDDVEESFIIKIGADEWPQHVLVVPIRVKERCVAILYGEAASAQALAEAREPAVALAELTAGAFVRLILAKKQKG